MEERVEDGGYLVCWNVPKGTEFGMDTHLSVTGENFKGFKWISLNVPHFVYFAATYKEMPTMRSGFWVNFTKPRQVIVKIWDASKEEFMADDLETEQKERLEYATLKHEFDPYMGSYPPELLEKWKPLVNHISPDLLSRLEPIGKQIHSQTKLEEDPTSHLNSNNSTKTNKQTQKSKDSTDARSKLQRIAEMMENVEPDKGDQSDIGSLYASGANLSQSSGVYYTTIPTKSFSSSPSELTLSNHDKSTLLSSLITSQFSSSFYLFLGELQFSFIHFWIGQSLDGLNQWKKMLDIITTSEKLLLEWQNNSQDELRQFILVWRRQLKELPQEWFTDEEWMGGQEGADVIGSRGAKRYSSADLGGSSKYSNENFED
eukprot:TRINITY_DN6702_c0_g1_i2.p1 TRINITY_DN6702_c0_g1~~TRINITY_DN6702_c0_g1_i2.p1  ORF type:complete len:373 (-),score=78.69 TRINITY_DN6702_c0_g1_i2:35-1153(-)